LALAGQHVDAEMQDHAVHHHDALPPALPLGEHAAERDDSMFFDAVEVFEEDTTGLPSAAEREQCAAADATAALAAATAACSLLFPKGAHTHDLQQALQQLVGVSGLAWRTQQPAARQL
jgi:hypothetical protein